MSIFTCLALSLREPVVYEALTLPGMLCKGLALVVCMRHKFLEVVVIGAAKKQVYDGKYLILKTDMANPRRIPTSRPLRPVKNNHRDGYSVMDPR
ncbi:hypothetical protein C5167_027616 [Papaver somniferum]|nr:hypothetical protein C5167_027616 [Papaver somniferum]